MLGIFVNKNHECVYLSSEVNSLPSGPVAGHGEVSVRVVSHLLGRLARIVQDLQVLLTIILHKTSFGEKRTKMHLVDFKIRFY